MESCRSRLRLATFVILAASMPSLAAQQDDVRIERLSWLSGCWEWNQTQRTVEEHWLAPRGGTMIGMGRTVRDGRTTEYELVVVKVENGGFAYEAHPERQGGDRLMAWIEGNQNGRERRVDFPYQRVQCR